VNTQIVGCDIGIESNGYGIEMSDSYDSTDMEGRHVATYIAGNYFEGESAGATNFTAIHVASKSASVIGNYFDVKADSTVINFKNEFVKDGFVFLGNYNSNGIYPWHTASPLPSCIFGSFGLGTMDSSEAFTLFKSGTGHNGIVLQTDTTLNAPFLNSATAD
jgi:hypothetical protein